MDAVMFEGKWGEALGEEVEKEYFQRLLEFVRDERERGAVYPPEGQVFEAFRATPYEKVRVVIVGQDPYHGEGQAHGLAFSVPRGTKAPPSLKNICKEIRDDLGVRVEGGCLTGWAEQGVLLLNTTLTVRAAAPLSHKGQGWEIFTDKVLELLGKDERPMVFVLWGNHAKKKAERVVKEGAAKLILSSAHPSPLSVRGFLGCRHFSRINSFLKEFNLSEIDFSLTH